MGGGWRIGEKVKRIKKYKLLATEIVTGIERTGNIVNNIVTMVANGY